MSFFNAKKQIKTEQYSYSYKYNEMSLFLVINIYRIKRNVH